MLWWEAGFVDRSASCCSEEGIDRDEMTVRLIVELLTPEAGDGDRFLRSVVLSMEKDTSASTNDGEGKKKNKATYRLMLISLPSIA